MATDSPTPAAEKPPKLRWYRLTPDRLVGGLLAMEGALLLSDRFRWFPFSRHMGDAAVVNLVVVGGGLLLMLVWFAAAVIFRWRFQYSLRSLFLLTTLVAVSMSCVAVTIQECRRQKAVADAIEKAGGWANWRFIFLREVLRDDSLVCVTHVNLSGRPTTDADLARLQGLTELEDLDLHNTEVSDEGLRHLSALAHLRWLNLNGTRVTDAGLVHLERLRELRRLYLPGIEVTVVHPHDGTLRLGSSHVTDEGVKKLQRALPKCQITH
jgi:hypothetical protein